MPLKSKNILILGGGISGLALLHYLSRRYAQCSDVTIRLLEKEGRAGGTIQTLQTHGCLFETGPNGFLDSKPRTLSLVEDLKLDAELVKAEEQAKIRYISVRGSLYALPSSLRSFLAFPPLTALEKLRVLGEFFVPRGLDPDESVYAFGKRRLGEKFAQLFLDPMISGIYGGDAGRINLRAAFPRIYQLEQEFGSLFKAMIGLKKQGTSGKTSAAGMPMGTLTSFRQGQSRLVEALARRYEKNICLDREVQTVSRLQGRFSVRAGENLEEADELFVSVPAYRAADILQGVSASLARELARVEYVPIAVVGLVFPLAIFRNLPEGFGYVIPSDEKKEVLGVLFESNIFPQRCPQGQVLFRVMAGGARHADILKKSQEEIIRLGVEEVQKTFSLTAGPLETMCAAWPRAIPQYTKDYFDIQNCVEGQLKKFGCLHLVANYSGGVSLNDCIENAYQAAQRSCL